VKQPKNRETAFYTHPPAVRVYKITSKAFRRVPRPSWSLLGRIFEPWGAAGQGQPSLFLPLAAGLPPLPRKKGEVCSSALRAPPQTLHQPLKGEGAALSPWSRAEKKQKTPASMLAFFAIPGGIPAAPPLPRRSGAYSAHPKGAVSRLVPRYSSRR
jgi:hypothetical protein